MYPVAIIPLVVGGVLIGLAALAGATAAYQSHVFSRSWVDALVDSIADIFGDQQVGGFPSGASLRSDAIEAARRTRTQLSRAAGARIGTLGAWYAGLDWIVRDLAASLNVFAGTTADALEYQGRVAIPREAERAAAPANRRARVAQRTADHATRTARGATRKATTAASVAVGGIAAGRLRDRSQDRTIERIRTRAGRLEHAVARHETRLARLSRLLTAAGAAALVSAAMVRTGFRFWRCSNFKRLGRRLTCSNFDPDAWGDLLLGTLLVLGSWSVVDAVKDLQRIEDESIAVMRAIIREL